MKLKINKTFGEYKAGEIIDVKSKNGVPSSIFIRRRLKEALIDGCVELVLDDEPKKEVEKIELDKKEKRRFNEKKRKCEVTKNV